MIRIAFALAICFTCNIGAAMAAPKDATIPQRIPSEDAMASKADPQREADLARLLDGIQRGDITFDDAMKQYRGKYYGGKAPDWNKPVAQPEPLLPSIPAR